MLTCIYVMVFCLHVCMLYLCYFKICHRYTMFWLLLTWQLHTLRIFFRLVLIGKETSGATILKEKVVGISNVIKQFNGFFSDFEMYKKMSICMRTSLSNQWICKSPRGLLYTVVTKMTIEKSNETNYDTSWIKQDFLNDSANFNKTS